MSAARQSPLTELLLSLSQSLNAAFDILHELNCRLNASQPSDFFSHNDVSAIIKAHRLSTLEAIRTLNSQGMALRNDSHETCQLAFDRSR